MTLESKVLVMMESMRRMEIEIASLTQRLDQCHVDTVGLDDRALLDYLYERIDLSDTCSPNIRISTGLLVVGPLEVLSPITCNDITATGMYVNNCLINDLSVMGDGRYEPYRAPQEVKYGQGLEYDTSLKTVTIDMSSLADSEDITSLQSDMEDVELFMEDVCSFMEDAKNKKGA